MKTFAVGFKVADGIYSTNMIWANTGRAEYLAVRETAERRAARYGYEIGYIRELTDCEVESNLRKGMPMYPIDQEAEEKYDPSFTECPA